MTTNVQGERGHTLTHDGHSLSLVYLIIIVSCHFTGHLAIYMGKLAAVKISSIYSIYYHRDGAELYF